MLISLAAASLSVGSVRGATTTPDPHGITVSPFLQKVSLASFEASKSFTVKVTNHTSALRTFRIEVADFGSLDESGGIAFLGQSNNYVPKHGLRTWLSIDQQSFTLRPSQTVTLTGSIRNETSLLPGGHYGAILVHDITSGHKGANSVATQPTVSALIFADKLGGETHNLHLDSFTQNGNWAHLPSGVSLRFFNPGNVEVTPRGTVDLLDHNNHLVKRGIINEDSGLVLPGTFRRMHVTLGAVSPTGWWPTHYTLAIHYRYDGTQQTAIKQMKIPYWNLPHLLLLLTATLVVLLTVYQVVRHRLWKNLRLPLRRS